MPTQIRNTFTLIELLVVVSIIAVLASMLLPSLSNARDKARSVACLNNLKQIHLGIQVYIDESEDFCPRGNQGGGQWGQSGVAGNGWLGQVYSNIKSLDVIKCPTDSYKHNTYATLSYYYSQNLAGGDKGNTWRTAPWKLGELTNPSNTVMLWESTRTVFDPTNPTESNSGAFSGWHLRGGVPASGILYGITPSTNFWDTAPWFAGYRHARQSNYLAADGHALALTGLEVSGGQTAYSADYTGGNYTQARGARLLGPGGVKLTMSPR